MTDRDAYDVLTSIQVTVKLRDKLKEMGKKGDTYEDILWGLIQFFENHNKTT